MGQPKRRLRRWQIVAALLGLLACAVTIPFAGALGWIVGITVDAGKGARCPECAVMAYLANHPISEWRDDIAYNHVLCSDKRKDLTAQGKAFTDIYRETAQRHQLTVTLSPGRSETTTAGNRAIVKVPVLHELHGRQGARTAASTHEWTFTVIDDNGWRVCEVQHPDVCRELISCEPPQTSTPSATPSPRPWDTRVGWRCLPDTPPHFKRSDCPTPPPDWTPPGPYVCAPDYPDVMRTDEDRQWCVNSGYQRTH